MCLHIIIVLLSFVFACVYSHQAEVSAPWQIPVHEAHSFLTKPTRFKRSDPRCNTDEPYCETNIASCMQHNEQSREYYCGLGHSCSPTQACYLSVPCPAHYTLGCSDDLCLSLPCYNGGSCTDTGTTHSCSCVPGWDSATDCSTDYDECQSTPCLNGGSCNNLFNDFTCDCNDRFEGEICEKDCRPGPVDIVFIVDTSKSMETSVNKSINYIEQFIRRVPIGQNDFQVGLVTYNLNATVMFDLDDFTTTSDISNAMRAIIGEDGPTITAPALRKAYQIITSSSYGARTGSTYKYIILLHDGLSTDRNEAIQEANKLSALGMRIYTVAIGDSISHMEMLMLSTQQYHTFSPLNSDDMYHQMMKETAHQDCTDCALETSTEVVMLLDTSRNQTFENYLKRSTAIRHAIEALLSYNSVTNIGMYSYSDDIDLVFPLAWSHDKDDLISAALQVSRDSHLSTPNTSHALSHLRTNNIFSASSRKIVIILSNGVWSDQDNVMSEIEQLANDGIDVKSILTGDDSKSNNFNAVLQDPSYNYYVGDGNYSALDSLAATTKRYVCIKDIFTKRQ